MLTKSDPAAGSTGYAQGGIAAAVGPDDSPERHAADTIAAGDGLCEPAGRGRARARRAALRPRADRLGRGVRPLPDGRPHLAREGAHGVRRVLHAADATGREIGRVLAARLVPPPAVTVIDHAPSCS